MLTYLIKTYQLTQFSQLFNLFTANIWSSVEVQKQSKKTPERKTIAQWKTHGPSGFVLVQLPSVQARKTNGQRWYSHIWRATGPPTAGSQCDLV